MNVPPMDNSAMDGYAVRLADLKGAEPRLRVAQKIFAGAVGKPLAPGTAARIFTGAPIPPGADAVVMQEDCTAEGDQIVVKKIPQPGEWIRRVGSDIRAGDAILPAGIRLRPQDTGLAASVGIASLPVHRRVRLGLFFTGDELVMPGDPLAAGAHLQLQPLHPERARARFRLRGARLRHRARFARRRRARCCARAAAECDVIVTERRRLGRRRRLRQARGGGRRRAPHVAHLDEARTAARVRRGRRASFIGLPGNPVSSFVTFLIFVRPFLLQDAGHRRRESAHSIQARADFDWPEPDARREFLRVKWNARGGLDLYHTQDSAVLTSTAWADGLVDNPADAGDPRGRDGDVHAVLGAVSMKVKVLYFAGLREQLGKPGEDLELPPATSTVAGLRTHLMARGGAWQSALAQRQGAARRREPGDGAADDAGASPATRSRSFLR